MCSPANARRLLDAMERLEAGRGVAHDLVESDRRAARRGRERREDYLWAPHTLWGSSRSATQQFPRPPELSTTDGIGPTPWQSDTCGAADVARHAGLTGESVGTVGGHIHLQIEETGP